METSRLAAATVSLSGDLRTALRRARDLGLRGVELDARSGLEPGQATQTGLRQIRKWLGDEGIVVSAIAFRTRSGYADSERLEGRIAATKSALELAHALGASVVLNHVGDIPATPEDPQWRLLVDVLTDIGTWGQRVGATLCAEAGRAAPGDLVRLIESLPEGALACDVVTGALVVHGHDPVAAVTLLASHLQSVHATDAVAGPFAGRGRAVVLGTGEVDFPAVLGALEEHDYHGWIGLEPVEGRAAREELAAAIQYLRDL
jgi:sugar phosphate isomerase/epimerase